MWFNDEKLSGYERLRREQPRVSTIEQVPRLFCGDIVHKSYENSNGTIRLIQNNDYEELKRVYFVEITPKIGEVVKLRTENRKEAGELYDKHRLELMDNE